MNSKTWTRIIALTLFAALANPVSLAAQDNAKQHHHHKYHHYQINDVGTFGGPQSFLWAPGLFRAGVLNNQGTLAGLADTVTVDPYCLDYPDCYAPHAFQWQNDRMTALGVLPGGFDSEVNWISANGLMAGASDNGQQDPLNPAFPQIHAVLWDHGQMTDLGTLPEGGYSSGSWAAAVNNRGEVAGQAFNTIPDPSNFSVFGYGYRSRAFYWKNGKMQDLGTLGTGADAMAGLINDRGQVVGVSYINSIPSAFCSNFGFPLTTGAFIWDKKNGMQNIGGLGGTCTVAYDLNNRGQVVGQATPPGDPTNLPFIWDRATGVTQLPTAAGLFGIAEAVDDAGEVVGTGDAPDGQTSATLWRKTGGKWQTTYLGRLHSGDCVLAFSVNAPGQVVGVSADSTCVNNLPFLWEDGGPMVDVNTLVPPTSGLQLLEAHQINDRGEIAVGAVDANGNNRSVLLIPCDEHHPGVEGCDYSMVDASPATLSPVPRYVPSGTQRPPQSRWSNRYHIPGRQSPGR
jgi:probable HAF family extracellular repeat protein